MIKSSVSPDHQSVFARNDGRTVARWNVKSGATIPPYHQLKILLGTVLTRWKCASRSRGATKKRGELLHNIVIQWFVLIELDPFFHVGFLNLGECINQLWGGYLSWNDRNERDRNLHPKLVQIIQGLKILGTDVEGLVMQGEALKVLKAEVHSSQPDTITGVNLGQLVHKFTMPWPSKILVRLSP